MKNPFYSSMPFAFYERLSVMTLFKRLFCFTIHVGDKVSFCILIFYLYLSERCSRIKWLDGWNWFQIKGKFSRSVQYTLLDKYKTTIFSFVFVNYIIQHETKHLSFVSLFFFNNYVCFLVFIVFRTRCSLKSNALTLLDDGMIKLSQLRRNARVRTFA